jgi:hypothetical protein
MQFEGHTEPRSRKPDIKNLQFELMFNQTSAPSSREARNEAYDRFEKGRKKKQKIKK